MTRSARLASLVGLVLAFALPTGASASAPNNLAATYEFFLEVPNIAMASDGDTVEITGEGDFAVHAKSASGGGDFTHNMAEGGSVTGTWSVNSLVDFQPYGCGVVFGTPLPPDFCGGRLSLDVTFHTEAGSLPGRITVYCVIGSPPSSAEEGVRVFVPGIDNFNKQVSGMNVYVQQ
jgi:hypothetical protein